MNDVRNWDGVERRRPDTLKAEMIRAMVAEGVKEALKDASLIDGPTHIKHHQAIEEALVLLRHARKTGVAAIVSSLFVLLALGVGAWLAGRSGG